MKPQVPRTKYFNSPYLHPTRLCAYGYQLQEIFHCTPDEILEIGIGNGIVSDLLRKAGYRTTTVDVDPALNPDIVASVIELPFADNTFDVVACFEVLEHIPWHQFEMALNEIYRMCRKYTLISLPDARPAFRIHIPFVLRERVIPYPFYKAQTHEFNGEHYWEINKKGFPLSAIISKMTGAGFTVEKSFRNWGKSDHRFFRLHK